MKQAEIGFVQGVVWAAAFMAADHGEDALAVDIIKESGIQKIDLSCCSEYDLNRLRRVIPELPKGRA